MQIDQIRSAERNRRDDRCNGRLDGLESLQRFLRFPQELIVNSFYSLILLLATAGGSPELISHRGESHDAPENTMAAFRLAWEREVPAIELDVHLTKDGQLIVCHDPDTERTTGKKLE